MGINNCDNNLTYKDANYELNQPISQSANQPRLSFVSNRVNKKYFKKIVSYSLCLLLVSCKGFEAKKDSTSQNLPTCTNNTVTTEACKIDGAGVAVTDSISDIISSNIKNGITLFGVLGNYIGSGSFVSSMASMMFRDATETQITLETESVSNPETPYTNNPTGYRAIPKILKDDDGYTAENVTYVDRTGWGAMTCGTSQTSIELRIADCAGTLGTCSDISYTDQVTCEGASETWTTSATWDGATKGNSGQGTWRLVSRTGDIDSGRGREVWRDERTKLLWSSLVSTNLNWCKASGNNQIAGNPTAEDDPSNYCDLAGGGTYQNDAGRAISACFEDDLTDDATDNGTNFTYVDNIDGEIDNAGKAGLRLFSTPRVAWRLPTIDDFKLADVNGIRFVMPEMGINSGYAEWSASVYSSLRFNAWYFLSDVGFVLNDPRNFNYAVRCVGR